MAGTASSRSASESTTRQFLPPISATTRFTCGCASGVSAAARTISRPTALEPVKAIVCTRGSRTSAAPTSPKPGSRETAPGGTPASRSASTSIKPRRGRLLRGLQHHAVARGEGGRGHAGGDRQGEVPGRDHGRHAARLVAHRVPLARHLQQLGARAQAQRLARVVLEEVDRLAHVGVRLGPRLRALAHLERRQLEAARAQDRRGPHQHLGAPLGTPFAPLGPGGRGRLHRGARVGLGGAPRRGHHARGPTRVGRLEPLGGAALVPDENRHAQRQSRLQLGERVQQRLARGRAAQLQRGLVGERDHGGDSSSSSGTPRACSCRNDSFEVFSRSRRTR